MIEEIRSRSNQWIKKALQLKQRKYRQAYGMFLMEGLRSVEDALRQGMKTCTCFSQKTSWRMNASRHS